MNKMHTFGEEPTTRVSDPNNMAGNEPRTPSSKGICRSFMGTGILICKVTTLYAEQSYLDMSVGTVCPFCELEQCSSKIIVQR